MKSQRAAFYPNQLAHAQWSNETIRPVQDSVPVDMRKVILGNLLFHDVRLSADNTVSCSSCHGLNTGGVDNKQFSEGVGGQFGGVNAPSVYNAAFSKAFKEVYPDGFNQANITDAIQEFERTLLTPNSRFDKYLKGDNAALTAEELAGYDLFKKYNCATCHVGENMGGQSYELLGIKHDYFADRGTELTIEDNGRFKETKDERDRHRFKVPGLRNVALTAPYFHDGTQATLEDAVIAMAKYEVGVDLSKQEVAQMVSFLRTLTGEYQGKLLVNENDLQK